MKIELPSYCYKVTVCDDKVFAPIGGQKIIQVYNKQGQLLNTIANEGRPVCIEKSPFGEILVCCCDTGLFVLKEDSMQPVIIASGEYSDMCMYGDKVYTWDYENKQILEFLRENMERKKQKRVVNVGGEGVASQWDTLLVRQCEAENGGVEFFVCLWSQHTILRVSEKGEQILQYGNRSGQGEEGLHWPRICGVDSGGQILVAGGLSCKYVVINTDTGMWMTVFSCDETVYDAKVESESTVWFSRYINGKYIITRHEPAKKLV